MTGFIKPSKPFILGIAGGSGSGKTYLAQAVRSAVGDNCCEIILQDNFYIDQSARFDFDGGAVNFDHPDSLDFGNLASCLQVLKTGQAVEIPIYDFKSHKRLGETLRVEPKPLIIVDGILIFHSQAVREVLDGRIFCQTEESLRYSRRLARDVNERGRTPEGVQAQFLKQVKPMHDQFVEPSKVFADTMIDEAHDFDRIIEFYRRKFSAP